MSSSFRALSSCRAVRTLAVMSVCFSTVRSQALNYSPRVLTPSMLRRSAKKTGHPVAALGTPPRERCPWTRALDADAFEFVSQSVINHEVAQR